MVIYILWRQRFNLQFPQPATPPTPCAPVLSNECTCGLCLVSPVRGWVVFFVRQESPVDLFSLVLFCLQSRASLQISCLVSLSKSVIFECESGCLTIRSRWEAVILPSATSAKKKPKPCVSTIKIPKKCCRLSDEWHFCAKCLLYHQVYIGRYRTLVFDKHHRHALCFLGW